MKRDTEKIYKALCDLSEVINSLVRLTPHWNELHPKMNQALRSINDILPEPPKTGE